MLFTTLRTAHKSPSAPSDAKILPLRGADCSALRRMTSFMGGGAPKKAAGTNESTKTRSSQRRFWKSRSRSSILHGAPARQLAMHWATPGEQWLLPLRHSSSGAWLKPCPWLGIQLGQRLTLTALFAALFPAASSPPHPPPMHPRPPDASPRRAPDRVALHPRPHSSPPSPPPPPVAPLRSPPRLLHRSRVVCGRDVSARCGSALSTCKSIPRSYERRIVQVGVFGGSGVHTI